MIWKKHRAHIGSRRLKKRSAHLTCAGRFFCRVFAYLTVMYCRFGALFRAAARAILLVDRMDDARVTGANRSDLRSIWKRDYLNFDTT